MRKIILLIAVVLTGCDFSPKPKCWDTEAKKFLLKETYYTETNNDTASSDFMKETNYRAISIEDIYEKNDGICVATVKFSNNKTWVYTYKVADVKTEKGKQVRIFFVNQ